MASSNTHGRYDEIFVTDFDEKSAKQFREHVINKSSYDPDAPIIVYISSYGGQVDALASMVETIESVPNKIITVCLGHAMSCGAILFSFGDYRFVGRHSRIMIHEVSGGAIGDTHDVYNDAAHIKELNQYWLGQLAKNSGFKNYEDLRNHIKKMDGRNLWLTAKEAVNFGIADHVGLPSIEPAVAHRIMVKSERELPARKVSPFSVSAQKTTKKTKKKTARRKKKS